MGSFDTTCCLTNTAISAGEKVVIIMLKANRIKSFYHLSNAIAINPESLLQDIIVGHKDDYDGLEEEHLLPKNFDQIRMTDRFFMCHAWAVEYLLKAPIKKLLKDKPKLVKDLFVEVFYLRQSLLDARLRGQQYCDIEEMETMISFHKKIIAYLRKKIKLEKYFENG